MESIIFPTNKHSYNQLTWAAEKINDYLNHPTPLFHKKDKTSWQEYVIIVIKCKYIVF